jgi:lipopolysaccharide/colanic/teichoic acid biosynthesis glycosyltransferase
MSSLSGTELLEEAIEFQQDAETRVLGHPAIPGVFKYRTRVSAINAGFVSELGSRRFFEAAQRTSSMSYRFAKRGIDILLCSISLPILIPLFSIIALAVRLSSPGPIFYRERRVGQGGKLFTILKFRSMYTKEHLRDVLGYHDCEESVLNRRFHQKREPDRRITRAGQFLRRSSLDELPQLLNVMRGDMSLIGPRPVVEAELDRFGIYADYYRLALPGITGLWQVSGRNNVTYERRTRMDAAYCTGWNPQLDLKILLFTVPAVLRGKGAY